MGTRREIVKLSRDCQAWLIPEGRPLILAAGSEVMITQALGGDITVYADGNLAQIFADDAHVLGEKYQHHLPQEDANAPLEERIWNRLRSCYDPEIPVNIVDLGLVYDCQLHKKEDGKVGVTVKMTLTAPACGMGPIMAKSVKHRLLGLEGVSEAEVDIVFDPPWGREMMSEAAQLELGIL